SEIRYRVHPWAEILKHHSSSALKLGQIEAQRGVGHDVATLRRSANTAPQAAMYVHNLVSLLDPAELALIEAIPITRGRFIDVAIGTVARIERYLVRATGITGQRRTITGSRSTRRDKCIPARVFISAVRVQIKTAATVIYNSSHDPGFPQRT